MYGEWIGTGSRFIPAAAVIPGIGEIYGPAAIIQNRNQSRFAEKIFPADQQAGRNKRFAGNAHHRTGSEIKITDFKMEGFGICGNIQQIGCEIFQDDRSKSSVSDKIPLLLK